MAAAGTASIIYRFAPDTPDAQDHPRRPAQRMSTRPPYPKDPPTELVGELLAGSTPTLLASNLVAPLVYTVIAPYVPGTAALLWFVAFTAINLARLIWARLELVRYRRHPARSANLYALGAFLGGSAWAAILGLYTPEIPSQSALLVLFILVCLPPAALPSNALHAPSFLAFALPLFVGLQYWAWYLLTELNLEFSLLGLTYSILVTISGLRYGSSLRENILRNEENRGLLREIRAMNEQLRQYAYKDPLTELANRRHFDEHAENLLSQIRDTDQALALFLIDIDDFKAVNDSLGHDAGDQLLQHVAERIVSVSRHAELVAIERFQAARLGGDEFVVLYQAPANELDADAIAHRLLEAVTQPLELEGRTFRPKVSIGVACGSARTPDIRSLMRAADRAMYRAKEAGGNRITCLEPAESGAGD